MAKRRKAKFTKGEVLLYSMAFICLFGSVVCKIFFSAGITNLNMNIEQTKYDISAQEKVNESLTMKVNELTAYDKVKDVVSDMGLAYNNDSIVIIND
jgi:cell division protein FtsL